MGFVSPDREDISLIIETTEAKADQALVLRATESLKQTVLYVWCTDRMEQFIQQPDLAANNGTWTATLNPDCIYSLTTTTGQRKGSASSPPPSLLPLPYREGFEGYRPNGTARYLSDMGGAFEVVAREGGGECLRQQVHRPGIDWANAAYAYAVVGDDRWNNIQVDFEGNFESLPEDPKARGERFVGILARWYPGSTWIHFTTPEPAGYGLRVFGDGHWELTTAREVLAQGTTPPPGEAWLTLGLRCEADQIAATLNGRILVNLRDSTYQRGLVGTATRFHPARFDNLLIENPRTD